LGSRTRAAHFLKVDEKTARQWAALTRGMPWASGGVEARLCRWAVPTTSTLATNELEHIAATQAAGTDSSTAGGSGFHVDRVALLIAVNWAHNPLFGDLNFSGLSIDFKFA
jgi:hypothetical protein